MEKRGEKINGVRMRDFRYRVILIVKDKVCEM
jgi:hypothetical protein